MAKRNIYKGNCLSCGKNVEAKKGFIKMKNPQKGNMIGKKRIEDRKWGVYCCECFSEYEKTMREKYHDYI